MNAASDLPADPTAALAALKCGRNGMIDVLRTVKPMGPVYHGASMVLAAIDALATLLTGDPHHFAAGGSVGPDRVEAIRRRQEETSTA